ncbi:hypothetical protein F441_14362 [Phytophthora nicotianae CJ01A1]|uniref:Uncharacterized protein n=5 Tax=Phytophthora nicotianae TaxID=4792 RepID=W2PXK3_PHYN3|nr:hypothetical protein PPTG_14539 [Phytophthora nicotianae INRA-310]ETK80082.1 hypothetical protein L915_14127 [Phytophthora nicotianae]ETO68754.1 hypothetical protein F444_14479 [Phytophthora nicotianae P1976]ETP09822.1 hypothetical protein F441_14362 [Phytophthora nicotianae CJ01A1]ETP37905.1 hypothetical protein F442_14324 [Phytophthora nicotianae P10297]KUF80578.1 hypothetical protein AM587_10011042 [Phytophthora nicotianae]
MPPRRGPPRIAKTKKQKQLIVAPSAGSRLCYILDLGSASVWDYLDAQSASNTLRACPGVFSRDSIDSVSLKAVQNFAVEYKTHLGRHCECDWMRRLDFTHNTEDKCKGMAPFTVDKTLPILQLPGGPKRFLDALLLTKKLMQPFEAARRSQDATFEPMVCPLVTKEIRKLSSKAAVTRAMNGISPGAGSRFFYKFKLSPKPYFVDFLEEHWSGIKGSSCEYCDSLADSGTRQELKKNADLTTNETKCIRANCLKLYRPLKGALERNLRFVRFVRRPRRRSRRDVSFIGKYKGLVAGLTEGGVLCGLFLVNGFWPHE